MMWGEVAAARHRGRSLTVALWPQESESQEVMAVVKSVRHLNRPGARGIVPEGRDGRVVRTTGGPDFLGDLGDDSTFHPDLVELRSVMPGA